MPVLKYNKKRLGATLGLILLGLLYYGVVSTLGFGIPCVFEFITGLKCPGCGITTAIVFLLQGDFSSAFRANIGLFIVLPLLIPVVILSWYNWILLYGHKLNNQKLLNCLSIICVILLMIWWIIRNILTL